MRRKPSSIDRTCSARLLAGVLLLGLFALAPLRAASAPDPTPPPEMAEAAIPAPDAVLVNGPASLTLGAEARLELPEGWRFVPRDQLPAFWRGQDKVLGAWDRGVAIDAAGHELRLLFEPCGRVASDKPLDTAGLLGRAQALLRKAPAAGGRELLRWQKDPQWEPEASFLALSAVWRSGEEESASLHLRWLGRSGVLKLDWRGPQDHAEGLLASAELLQKALSLVASQAHASAGTASKLDLEALALDGLVGRLGPTATAEDSVPLWAWLAGSLAGLAALGWGFYKGLMGFSAWLEARRKAQADAARLDKLEKDYGGRAADVEEIEE